MIYSRLFFIHCCTIWSTQNTLELYKLQLANTYPTNHNCSAARLSKSHMKYDLWIGTARLCLWSSASTHLFIPVFSPSRHFAVRPQSIIHFVATAHALFYFFAFGRHKTQTQSVRETRVCIATEQSWFNWLMAQAVFGTMFLFDYKVRSVREIKWLRCGSHKST